MTTQSTIENTVRTALSSNGASGYYDTYARPVVASLVEREQDIAERLIERASDMDMNPDEVRAALLGVGLSVKDAEPEDVEDEDEDATTTRIASALERIEQRIESLTDFARRNGYRG